MGDNFCFLFTFLNFIHLIISSSDLNLLLIPFFFFHRKRKRLNAWRRYIYKHEKRFSVRTIALEHLREKLTWPDQSERLETERRERIKKMEEYLEFMTHELDDARKKMKDVLKEKKRLEVKYFFLIFHFLSFIFFIDC